MIRFIRLFNYEEGVSLDDGESWYLSEHVPLVKKLPGMGPQWLFGKRSSVN